MTTKQEMIDQLVRYQLGDLLVQIAVLKATLAELEATAAVQPPQMPMPEVPPEVIKPNGKQEKRAQDG